MDGAWLKDPADPGVNAGLFRLRLADGLALGATAAMGLGRSLALSAAWNISLDGVIASCPSGIWKSKRSRRSGSTLYCFARSLPRWNGTLVIWQVGVI